MILSRRHVHLSMWIGLAVILPIVFLFGLIFRPSIPTVDEYNDELFMAANYLGSETGEPLSSAIVSINGIDIDLEIAQLSNAEQRLILTPQAPLQFSELLVYWTPGETLPEQVDDAARLLGQLSGTSMKQFPIFSEMKSQPGHFLFYSLGQNTVITAVPVPDKLFP